MCVAHTTHMHAHTHFLSFSLFYLKSFLLVLFQTFSIRQVLVIAIIIKSGLDFHHGIKID